MKELIGKTTVMRNRIILLLFILIVLGNLVTYFFSRAIYNPVKELMTDIQNRKGIDFKGMGNEMAILSRVFDSMLKQHAGTEEQVPDGSFEGEYGRIKSGDTGVY
jgi:uncharacterized ion transporter superfamily protein YfcC